MSSPSETVLSQRTPRSPREAAVQVLERYEPRVGAGSRGQKKSVLKSNLLLDEALLEETGPTESPAQAETRWSEADRRLFTALVYGVLRQWTVLDAILAELSHFPLHKIDPRVRTLLRIGLYQLRYMDHIPDYAAVDSIMTMVTQLKRQKRLTPKTASYVNGLLRAYPRRVAEASTQGKPFPPVPDLAEDPAGWFSVTYSWPRWFAQRMLAAYDPAVLQTMGEQTQQPAPLSLRVNLLNVSLEAFHQRLADAGIPYRLPDPEILPEGIILEGFHGSPTRLPGFSEGWFAVQDLNSARVARWVDPQPGETIVDLCAAPGSKTAHLADLMRNQGTIWAVDPSEQRIRRLKENMTRLGVSIVQPVVSEAERVTLPESSAPVDRVLVDAPCSGTGTIRRHPEILLQRTERQMAAYPTAQRRLLEAGASLVRPGGVLVYSTCSLDPAENQAVADGFSAAHPEWTLLAAEQRLLTADGDGFFIAKWQRQHLPD